MGADVLIPWFMGLGCPCWEKPELVVLWLICPCDTCGNPGDVIESLPVELDDSSLVALAMSFLNMMVNGYVWFIYCPGRRYRLTGHGPRNCDIRLGI